MQGTKQGGFSLVEVMISLVILSIGVLAITMMQLKLSGATQQARQRAEAVTVATTRIEQMRNAGACAAVAPTTVAGSVDFTLTITCTSNAPEVTLTWNDLRGETNNVRIRTTI